MANGGGDTECATNRQAQPTDHGVNCALLGWRLGCVLVASHSDKAEFRQDSEHLCSNIRTLWVVTKVFGEFFFAPIRSRKARLDRHLRNGESPN